MLRYLLEFERALSKYKHINTMKKQLLFILITILGLNCYSQISFEKGYYIDNNNQKIDCLIKNIDWENSPAEFKYKLSANSEPKKASLESVKEFGIYNISKYIRNTVNIDRSSPDISKMSTVRRPVFEKEQLFLKVLVEGKTNLYQYKQGKLVRFFYNMDSSNIEQLVYKSYRTPDNKIGKNYEYKQQLWNYLKCPNFKLKKVENLDYEKNELINFFVEYNKCINQEYISYEKKQKKDLFNLSIRPGLNSSTLSIHNTISSYGNTDFDNELAFRFGIEGEFVLPFNKNKWAMIIEPTYQYFKSETEFATLNVKAVYKSIELPVGVRHYFFLNDNSKLFVDGSFIFGSFIFQLIDNSVISIGSNDLEIVTGNNAAFGLGYKYNDRYSLELRYLTSRNILRAYSFWRSDYNTTLSVIFGYSLF